jgi:hypothetical protein
MIGAALVPPHPVFSQEFIASLAHRMAQAHLISPDPPFSGGFFGYFGFGADARAAAVAASLPIWATHAKFVVPQ